MTDQSRTNAMTVVIVIAAAILPYLTSQSLVVFPAWAILLITAANIGVTTYARLSGTTNVPVAEIASPIQTPAGATATVTETEPAAGGNEN